MAGKRDAFTLKPGLRYVENVPFVAGVYRVGDVYVTITADEIERLKALTDFAVRVRAKLQAAADSVKSILDIDDFGGKRRGKITEIKGPVADELREIEVRAAPVTVPKTADDDL